ncbi:uncharacterized protein LOC103972432 [Musa acuminata AAA Group]|uniref:Biogenesis of lysosome-related organelles complex 1 subunit 7 n=1 Tax=Musa acuminata subsp. malaccensis TaxID=214687 RepID=A0A804LBD1_MUSAM|nr:PREDICTED: uncharacterized protein LOC103972432 [Musa acuminata subsp. malaccensis]XP_009385046.1 PREDICTED: uncharacterized protein LOC103972432 [Musa acuminata subsp. malaccensis]CAG1865517.1 unnamed protein product [Musa acuminata subsp. malaccensis]
MDGSDLPALPASDSSVPPPSGGGGADGAEGPAWGREGCEALAGAIASTLGAVMREFDSRAEGVDRSQDELSTSLDRLARELDKLLEDAPLPFIMQHAAKISAMRRRVSALNLILKSIQRRIDNMDRMLFAGVPTDNHQQIQ